MFNNREIATAIWLTVFAILALVNPGIRRSIFDVVRAFLHWKILASVASMVLYTATIVLFLYILDIWNLELLKDTLTWLMFAAFPMVVRFLVASNSDRIFKQIVADNIKFVVLVEFLVGTYVMPLPVELILIPFAAFLVILDVFARLNSAHADVAKVTGALLSIAGLLIVGIAFYRAMVDYHNLGAIATIRSVLLAPVMSVAFSPFVYFIVLIATYESTFGWLNVGPTKTSEVIRYAKFQIIRHNKMSLRRLQSSAKHLQSQFTQIQTTNDVDRLFNASLK